MSPVRAERARDGIVKFGPAAVSDAGKSAPAINTLRSGSRVAVLYPSSVVIFLVAVDVPVEWSYTSAWSKGSRKDSKVARTFGIREQGGRSSIQIPKPRRSRKAERAGTRIIKFDGTIT